jgi:hypothetical protein
MATNLSNQQASQPQNSVIQWLLDSDPSIRAQVLRDLTDASPDEVAAERAKFALQGWSLQFLRGQGADGYWGSVVCARSPLLHHLPRASWPYPTAPSTQLT